MNAEQLQKTLIASQYAEQVLSLYQIQLEQDYGEDQFLQSLSTENIYQKVQDVLANLTDEQAWMKALRALRAIKSALLLAKTDKGGNTELSEDDGIKLLQKLVKQRSESVEIYTTQNRPDLAEPEQQEIAVIEQYLPQQLSADEIKKDLASIIKSVGATTAADMGKVMGAASKHFAGRADNKIVAVLIKELLG